MKSSALRDYGEDYFKHLLKRYRITKIKISIVASW